MVAVSVGFNFSSASQAKRVVETQSGDSEIGKMSGSGTYFSFNMDRPYDTRQVWRIGLHFRKLNMRGEVTPVSSGPVAGTPVSREQNLTGLLLLHRSYPLRNYNAWWGL